MNPNAVDFMGNSCESLLQNVKGAEADTMRANIEEAKQLWAQN